MIYIGAHIPKTGGSSIAFNLKEHLGGRFYPYGNHANRRRFFAEEDLFTSYINKQHQKLVSISGHGVDETLIKLLRHTEISLFTAFRDPYEHSISKYYHRLKRKNKLGIPFEQCDFYLSETPNPVSTQLVNSFPSLAGVIDQPLQHRVVNVLRHFRFLMCTERLNEQSELLFNAIGIPGMTEKKRVNNEKSGVIWSREETYENNSVDLYVYNLIRAESIPKLKSGIFLNPFGYDAENSRLIFEQMKQSVRREELEELFYTKFIEWLDNNNSFPAAKLLVTNSDKYKGSKLAELIHSFEIKKDLRPVEVSVQHLRLGEVYAYLGQFDKSIEYFEKSLEENPDNQRAKRLLVKYKEPNKSREPS